MEIGDDIDALVGAAGKGLCRIHQQFYLVVIFSVDMIHLVGIEEEMFLLMLIFSYHGRTRASFVLLIWLNENIFFIHICD